MGLVFSLPAVAESQGVRSCDTYLAHVEDAALVDQAMRRNWSPGDGNRPLTVRRSLYSDDAIYRIDFDHNELIVLLVQECRSQLLARESPITADQANAIWLLIQHHQSAQWQYDNIPVVRGIFQSGSIAARRYALFVDRAWWRTRQMQYFGTQGRCSSAGFEPFPINGVDEIDSRRSQIGLPPLADEIDRMSRETCGVSPNED